MLNFVITLSVGCCKGMTKLGLVCCFVFFELCFGLLYLCFVNWRQFNVYGIDWPICADVPLSNCSLTHSL